MYNINTLFFLLIIYWRTIDCRLEEDTYNANETEVCQYRQCFYAPASLCPDPKTICRCRRVPNCNRLAVCCNIKSENELIEGLNCGNISGNGATEALHIRNASLDVLNVTFIASWKRLGSITISDGHINSVKGEFSKLTNISCLNFSSNSITKFEGRPLNHLYNLKYLDLSNNNLTNIPGFKVYKDFTLDISNNENMLCTSVSEVLNRTNLIFEHENKTLCLTSGDFHWFNTTDKVSLLEVKRLHLITDHCILNCTCEKDRVIYPPSLTRATISVRVNCAGKQLLSLPSPLPSYTTFLNVTNNNITCLKPVTNDSSYEYLSNLYADRNQIDSILTLEGSKFLSNFQVLNLKHNKLKALPTYILSNSFDRNNNDRQLFLGQNKIFCDCSTANFVKSWLMTKNKQIPDYDEIFCSNMDARVLELNQAKLCPTQQDWTDYIYYIITCQVFLLVGLIVKVSYDYWVFKTAGYLPWPASKMPKLPCDWLCE